MLNHDCAKSDLWNNSFNTRPIKVLFALTWPTPYRVAFCNSLGQLSDLTVVYDCGYAQGATKAWQESVKALSFKEVFLNKGAVRHERSFSPSIIKHLSPSLYDIIVIGRYSTPTRMLAILYMRGRKIPFFLNADGGMINNDPPWKLKLKKFFIGSASMWLSSGAETDRYLKYYGANPERIERYPFTSVPQDYIDKEPANEYEKRELRRQLGIPDEKVVVTVGRFIYGKGFDILIRAAANINADTGVYIIGGEPTDEYLSLIKKYGVQNVHFVSFLNAEELKRFFRASDLFVLPTRYDVWGLVVNEAMASGLPVITTDKCVAGLELVEDHKNGFIVPIDNDVELAERITAVLSDECLRKEMAWESLRKIKDYSIENMAKVHFEIFQKFLSEKN